MFHPSPLAIFLCGLVSIQHRRSINFEFFDADTISVRPVFGQISRSMVEDTWGREIGVATRLRFVLVVLVGGVLALVTKIKLVFGAKREARDTFGERCPPTGAEKSV